MEKPVQEEKPQMESIREVYKIGRGPSSSHTIGPEKACKLFSEKYKDATHFKAILQGSLASTGKGHRTDYVINKTFDKPVEVIFDYDSEELQHPNTLLLFAYRDEQEIGFWRVFSIGGGSIKIDNESMPKPVYPYRHRYFSDIMKYCTERDIRIWQYALEVEGNGVFDYLFQIWDVMKESIRNGLKGEGLLPGGLEVSRKAKLLLDGRHIDESAETRENRIVCAYAYAVSEENACGGTIVTAPTCGSAGVLPAVMLYEQNKHNFSDDKIIKALATAGIIGNVIKTNASISGAECGCQAEIGSACSMTAAALGELLDMSLEQIEYAAEIAMEHHLGLTCDPIAGLVQIPCIERNAVAAMRAINAVSLANFLTHTRKISFDLVIQTMYETGQDMHNKYRETSRGGLAKLY